MNESLEQIKDKKYLMFRGIKFYYDSGFPEEDSSIIFARNIRPEDYPLPEKIIEA